MARYEDRPGWVDAAMRQLGVELRTRRGQAGLTQRELEAVSGVDQSTISRLENGLTPGSRAEYIARIFAACRRRFYG